MVDALDLVGNPSSVHGEGREARAAIEAARGKLARLVGASAGEIVFTSGGSEANAMSLGAVDGPRFISAIEHPSVLSAEDAVLIPVTSEGIVDVAALAELIESHHLDGKAPFLVSVMTANNETGAIQPVAEIAALVHEAGGLLHTDAVQSAGKLSLRFDETGADLMSLSAHKIGGPKGIGALVVREGLKVKPLIRGGAQETRRRAGTENVAGIAGFGAAAEAAAAELAEEDRIGALKAILEQEAMAAIPDAVVIAGAVDRLPNTVCIAVPGAKAETLVIGLDLAGVAVSAGSACSSGKVENSHVLTAMGLDPEVAEGAIRVSLGWESEEIDVEKFLGAWTALVKRLQQQRVAA